jgi:hypothetical protein
LPLYFCIKISRLGLEGSMRGFLAVLQEIYVVRPAKVPKGQHKYLFAHLVRRNKPMNKRAWLASLLAVVGAFGLAACGGGNGGSPPPVVSVTITTDVSNIETFQTVQFSATVTGTSNTAVTWQLSCNTTPASACGTMSAAGMYVAPNTVPTLSTASSTDPATLTVTATSQADSNATNSVGFTVDSLNMQPYTAPVPLGSSGGNADAICLTPAPGFCFGGTLGSLLTSNATPPALVILSNNHVLGMSDGATVGQEVTQPGVIETNCSLIGTINVATVTNILSLQNQPVPAFPVDVTTAQITTGQVDLTGSILELGAVTNGVPQPAPPAAGTGVAASMSELLAKSGRTTGLTCAEVESIDLTGLIVGYSEGCATATSFSVTYNDEIEVGNMFNGQNFIGDGDSGSLAVDAATAQPVALMFAGNENSAIGNPVADVLNALHASTGHTYTFVGGAQHAVPGCSLPGLSSVKVTPQSAAALPAGIAQRGQTAAASYSTQIMNTPGVSAYGGGGSLDAPNEPAVLMFVAPGASHAGIPTTIDGVRTRLIESNSGSARGALSTQQSAQLASQSEQAQAVEILASAIEHTKTIKEQHVAELMSDPAVVGVGVSASLDSPGDPALMIFVLKGKAHNAIPATIDGVRTRIKETSPFRANVAHPLKSPVGAGCHMPKNAPATTLNAVPAALQSSASPSPSVQPIALTITQR